MNLRKDAKTIINYAINAVLPDSAVRKALKSFVMPEGRLILISVGKAAWQMAKTALETIPDIDEGIVITKYEHVKGELKNILCYEAGHPVTDENGLLATEKALEMVKGLKKEDTVLFLLSGGASALFEAPLVTFSEYQEINRELLNCGADIKEINTIRKRLSKVKGGKFALACKPANVFNIFLSDIIDDSMDMIGSGPTYPDSSTSAEALSIVEKYHLSFSDYAFQLLHKETVKNLDNIESHVSGSVRELCKAAAEICEQLGYDTKIVDTQLTMEAKKAGKMIGKRIQSLSSAINKPTALIYGGETTVKVTGNGKGGRNQELVLSACPYLENTEALLFSIGSDGTDGPTDAAGGIVDSYSNNKLKEKNISVDDVLVNNDSYDALKKIDALIFTGPTGTNVNDLTIALINQTE